MMHDGDFQRLPGGETVAFVGIARLIGQCVTGIVPFLAARPMRRSRQGLRHFVKSDQPPAGGAFDPDAQHEFLAALDRNCGDLAITAHVGCEAGFSAEQWLGQSAGCLQPVENAAVEIDPGQFVIEQLRRAGIAAGKRHDQRAVGLYRVGTGREHRHALPRAGISGVPWVWNDSMVFNPQAWPFLRSSSVQVIGFQSGARISLAPALATSTRLPPGS